MIKVNDTALSLDILDLVKDEMIPVSVHRSRSPEEWGTGTQWENVPDGYKLISLYTDSGREVLLMFNENDELVGYENHLGVSDDEDEEL